jgi:lipid-A-disaccharide synthase-like uncharacterized protein
MGLPSRIFGVKWEPVAAMIALLFVGFWLVYRPGMKTHPGAYAVEVRIANQRGILETYTPQGSAAPVYHLALRNGFERVLAGEDVRREFGEGVLDTLTTRPSNALFRLLNITSWWSLPWILVGFGGQILFSGRTLVQWFVSEKERRSVVPPIFWWMSLVGGVSLFAYFAWRQDLVALLGQCSGVVIYARNIRLIYKHKRRGAADQPGAST